MRTSSAGKALWWMCLWGLLPAWAVPQTASDLYSRLKALKNTHTVLYVAAHPDDENTRLLTWLAHHEGMRVAYLSLTRGEGGQNLVGKEQGFSLGVLRTQELLAARRLDGAEQYFTTARDFGFSKSAEETLRFWNRDSVLHDIVWVIRWLQPDVVVCRFPTTGEGGHGHHTASAILTLEAHRLAADPTAYPGQLAWVRPFRCPRLLWNTFQFGTINTTDSTQFRVDVGTYLPLLGKSTGEIAAESRSLHRSQGFGTEKRRHGQWEYFKTLHGSPPIVGITDHVPAGWRRFEGLGFVDDVLDSLLRFFDLEKPEKTAPALLRLRQQILQRLEGKSFPPAIVQYRLAQMVQWALDACGFYAELTASQPSRVVNTPFEYRLYGINRSAIPIRVLGVKGWGYERAFSVLLERGVPLVDTLRGQSQWVEPVSRPYAYLEREPLRVFIPAEMSTSWNPEYHLEGAEMEAYAPVFHLPEYRPETTWRLLLEVAGFPIECTLQVQYKKLEPDRGEVFSPFVLVPPIVLETDKEFLLCSRSHSGSLRLTIRNYGQARPCRARLRAPSSYLITPDSVLFTLGAARDTQIEFTVRILPQAPADGRPVRLIPEVASQGEVFSLTKISISYPHIPEQILFQPLLIPACYGPWPSRSKTRCLYVEGAGDKGPDALRQLGFEVTVWEMKQPRPPASWTRNTDVVVFGIRALNTRDDLPSFFPELWKFVRKGGRVVFQYNTLQDLCCKEAFPLLPRISRRRVADETAPVEFLQPNHPLLKRPLMVEPSDFDFWVQERALYIPDQWNGTWTALLRMADAGEEPSDGSLLVAELGKGEIVYTTLSFFRQLPAAVPGAVKLFYNLIARGR
ncbi:MAG: PIG-L family deacetylase [Flavobacteriales bacterium]|nr:PIG-L family deacetylase [Flavobacteriales bacterium]MDW8409272.1 PIG-L family deacetylase [Flavobacteriales bacterium]